jgi:hypothetical protein
MSAGEHEESYRKVSSEIRALPLDTTMDPGFVHKRKVQTILGESGMKVVDELIAKLPDLPDWQRAVRIDHVYKDVFLTFCEIYKIKSLEEALATKGGHLISSVEKLAPCPEVYDSPRAVSRWIPRGSPDEAVEFHYSTGLIASDTLRTRLHSGSTISIVAEYSHRTSSALVFDPILMGFPWVRTSDPAWADKVMWFGNQFFENYVEDFEEFAKVRAIARPRDISTMASISEHAFKLALCEILGDEPKSDWGGETSDHFTDHLHLEGRRVSGAFVLKGPAMFKPMGLNHLGKNNNQIVRLHNEPADVLFVQHCHEILADVRSTLRAFAVQPSRARRYCLIDGWDSLRLLEAYGLTEKALAWSK